MNNIKQLALPFVAMVGAMVLANYTVQFVFQPFGWTELAKWATWGTVVYPVTFLINDLTNRFYGTKQTTKLILASCVVGLLLAAWVANPRIAVASGIAFLIAQQLDNKVFDYFRQREWWRAPLISSLLATSLDTWVFYIIAFAGTTNNADYFGFSMPLWVGWSFGDVAFKLGVALLLLLPYRAFLLLISSRQNAAAL